MNLKKFFSRMWNGPAPLKNTELIKGEIYTISERNKKLIFRFTRILPNDTTRIYSDFFLSSFNERTYKLKRNDTPFISGRHCRKATSKEKLWLLTSIKFGFVVLQSSLKTKDVNLFKKLDNFSY